MPAGRGRRRVLQFAVSVSVVIGGLAGAASASANTVLHVDVVHGHDTGNCQSTPCKTLSYAVAQGRLVPDLITIEAAAGTYTGDLSLGAPDSGLSIVGSGSGTTPAKSTIVTGVSGNPTFNATTAGDATALSLADLRIRDPSGDTSPAVQGASTNLKLNDVPVVTPGGGPGLVDSGADVALVKSPITLGAASGTSPAISGGNLSLTLTGSPIDVKDSGGGISNGGAPVTLTGSPINLEGTSGSEYGIANGGAAVTVSNSAIDVKGTGGGIANGGGPVTLTKSPITLENTGGSDYGIANGGAAVTLSASAIDVKGTGGGIANGGAPVTLTNSPITLENASGSDFAIANGGGAVAVRQSPIMAKGNGGGIAGGGQPVTVISSPISLAGTAGGSPAIVNSSSSVTVQSSNIDIKGTRIAVVNSAGATALSNLRVTLGTPANPDPALATSGRGSALSHVTISGAWSGFAIDDTGSLTVADSTLTSGPSPTAPLVVVSDGGSSSGRDISIERSRLTEHSSVLPAIAASNVDMAAVSSALRGGVSGVSFAVSGGVARSLTLVSSTVDAGVLGSRDTSPIHSITASSDNTSGSDALVNVEGSILVESPAASRGGTSGTTTVNCSHTEVPGTTQVASSTLGTINCATGARGNTSTSSLSAIFATPITSYKLNPSWGGVDSVPASAISVPAPFSDSATDLLGNPRVLNGRGTCLPGVRDKGAIELTGHGGVVPKPAISGPSHAVEKTTVSFTGKASNLPASVHPKFKWHTSDGANGTGKHFSHKFKHAGKFKVSLTVTGGAACTASVSKKVEVTPAVKHSARKSAVQAVVGTNSPYRRGTSQTTS